MSLDDLLAVACEFLNPYVSRSGSDCCLRRHGVGRFRDRTVKDDTPKRNESKASEPRYTHIDVKYPPHMVNKTLRGYLIVAIGRDT